MLIREILWYAINMHIVSEIASTFICVVIADATALKLEVKARFDIVGCTVTKFSKIIN